MLEQCLQPIAFECRHCSFLLMPKKDSSSKVTPTVPPSKPAGSVGSRRFWRRLRLWEKKRGNRQTGSSRWGAAGETLFYTALSVIGIVILAQLISLRVIWQIRNPLTSNLGLTLSSLLLAPLSITCAYWAIYHALSAGTSAERLADIANRAKDSDLLAEVQPRSKTALPTIPCDRNLKNSPGIRLAYRLPSAQSASAKLAVVATFCVLWNCAVAALAVLAINQDGGFGLLSLFTFSWWNLFRIVVVIYAVIGVFATSKLFQMLVRATAVGPTSIEVSDLPMLPGESYRVFLSQSGHLYIDWLELVLACDEQVSFTDGTDTRVERRRVFEESVFRHDDFEILPSHPFHCECPLQLPIDAMHSFSAEHSAVTWKLVVRLQARRLQSADVRGARPKSKTKDQLEAADDPSQDAPTSSSQPKRRTKARDPWSRFKRSIAARFRNRRTSPNWPTVRREFPVVLHPKP